MYVCMCKLLCCHALCILGLHQPVSGIPPAARAPIRRARLLQGRHRQQRWRTGLQGRACPARGALRAHRLPEALQYYRRRLTHFLDLQKTEGSNRQEKAAGVIT